MTRAEGRLRDFDEEFALTRKFLLLVPDDRWTWKPHEKSMELGRLAWHLAGIPEWCGSILRQDRMCLTPQDAEKWMTGWEGRRRQDLLRQFDADLAQARAALAATTDADMERNWQMEWMGQIVIDEPRDRVHRKYTMHHMVHHRAQLGVYLRLLGIPVPGCYGPSADDGVQEAVQAA